MPSIPVKEAARVLSGLGHVEFEQSAEGDQTTRWSAAPATIVVPENSPAFLAGFRSRSIVEGVTEIARSLGGETRIASLEDQPAVVSILGLDAGLLDVVADKAAPEARLRLVQRPSTALVGALPDLETLVELLPAVSYSTRYEEVFDVATARWVPNDGLLSTGAAIRTLRQPRAYALVERTESGGRIVLRQGDVRLVKHLAARYQQRPLAAYDAIGGDFLVPLGAELPWLLDRVAVLCSGTRPTRRGGVVAYSDVPAGVASEIWARLTGS